MAMELTSALIDLEKLREARLDEFDQFLLDEDFYYTPPGQDKMKYLRKFYQICLEGKVTHRDVILI